MTLFYILSLNRIAACCAKKNLAQFTVNLSLLIDLLCLYAVPVCCSCMLCLYAVPVCCACMLCQYAVPVCCGMSVCCGVPVCCASMMCLYDVPVFFSCMLCRACITCWYAVTHETAALQRARSMKDVESAILIHATCLLIDLVCSFVV